MAYKKSNANGQATMANSEPVVIASDQSAVPVTVSGVATAANQATIIGHVDGIETAIGTTNTTLTTIDGRVDGLETLSTATNTKLDTVITHVDGIETLIGTTNTTLTTIDGRVDGLEGVLGTTADAAATVGGTGSISAKERLMTTQLDAIQTAVQTLDNAIAGNEMQVDVLTMPTVTVNSHAVTNAGTFAVQVDGSALTALQLIDDTVFADDAAVTLGTSKGTLVEGVAVNMDGTDPTAVSAEGDAAALRSDPNRILLVNQTHPRFFRASADYASAQTNTTVQAAPGASLSLYVTDVIISNGATAGNITLLDGSGGSVLLEVYPGVNGGLTHSFRNPLKLTANTLLAITSTTVTTHSVTVTGYIAA